MGLHFALKVAGRGGPGPAEADRQRQTGRGRPAEADRQDREMNCLHTATSTTTLQLTLTLHRTIRSTQYEIIDNPARLGTGDWNRIVAVVAQGADWQFKNWKWSTTAEIFEKSMGYYFNVQGEDVPAIMKTWNVRCGKLVGDKGRDRDKATFATFWTGLDQWMSIHKPELL